MASMSVSWDHVPESDFQLEKWVTVIDGVALYVVKLPELPETLTLLTLSNRRKYVWRNSYTDKRHKVGAADNLHDAMIAAIRSLREDDSDVLSGE